MKKCINVTRIFICASLLGLGMMLGACGVSEPEPEIVTGGVENHTDPTAAKTIKSKDIVGMYTSFFVYDPYDYDKNGSYTFKVEKNSEGQPVLKTEGQYKHELTLTEEDLAGIQGIVDEYKLAGQNGIDKVTAGLAPEYGPITLEVTYASGERLYFRENGDPREPWALAMKAYLETLLIRGGFEDVKPSAEATTIDRFSIAFNVDHVAYMYGEYVNSENETVLCREVYDLDNEMDIDFVEAELTEELYTGLQEVIEANDMDLLNAQDTVNFDQPWISDGFLTIYVNYENGRQIYAEYGPETLPECWSDMQPVIFEYLESYVETHSLSREASPLSEETETATRSGYSIASTI